MDSPLNSAKVVRLTGVAASPTERVIHYFTHSTDNRWVTIAITSWNISLSTCWWKTASAEALSLYVSRTELFIVSTLRTRFSLPVVTDVRTSPAPLRTLAPATVLPWSLELICPIRISNSYSFIRPVSHNHINVSNIRIQNRSICTNSIFSRVFIELDRVNWPMNEQLSRKKIQ